MCAHVLCLYLCKKIETAQLADNTVHLRKSLPLSTGLKETVSNDKRKKQGCHYNTIKHGISLSLSKMAGVENPKSHKVSIHVFHSGNQFFPPCPLH